MRITDGMFHLLAVDSILCEFWKGYEVAFVMRIADKYPLMIGGGWVSDANKKDAGCGYVSATGNWQICICRSSDCILVLMNNLSLTSDHEGLRINIRVL